MRSVIDDPSGPAISGRYDTIGDEFANALIRNGFEDIGFEGVIGLPKSLYPCLRAESHAGCSRYLLAHRLKVRGLTRAPCS